MSGKTTVSTAAVATNHDTATTTSDALTNEVDGTFLDNDLDQVTADAVILGDPSQRAKVVVSVQGVGNKFSGNWYVKKARHVIDGSGYRVDLSLARNAVGGKHPTATTATGKKNEKPGPPAKSSASSGARGASTPPPMVTVDAQTGKKL